MSDQAVKNQQVAHLQLDIDDVMARHIRREWIDTLGLLAPPILDPGEDAGHALKAADLTALFLERYNALHRNRRQVLRRIDIEMDETIDLACCARQLAGRIEIGPVMRHPAILAIPDIDEGVVDAR